MRVNIYAEEMTPRVELVTKRTADGTFTGVRFYLELPITLANGQHASGPFLHHPGDDDSSAVTFWGKRDLRHMLHRALALLDEAENVNQAADAPVTQKMPGYPQGNSLRRD